MSQDGLTLPPATPQRLSDFLAELDLRPDRPHVSVFNYCQAGSAWDTRGSVFLTYHIIPIQEALH